MKIIITGLECSGTKWMCELLKNHPGVASATHASIPEFPESRTRLPELNGADAVVWIIRYEPFRLQSVAKHGYDSGREADYLPPNLYSLADHLLDSERRTVMVSYEGLIGPLGKVVFKTALRQLGLCPFCYPMSVFHPTDENLKYLTETHV